MQIQLEALIDNYYASAREHRFFLGENGTSENLAIVEKALIDQIKSVVSDAMMFAGVSSAQATTVLLQISKEL